MQDLLQQCPVSKYNANVTTSSMTFRAETAPIMCWQKMHRKRPNGVEVSAVSAKKVMELVVTLALHFETGHCCKKSCKLSHTHPRTHAHTLVYIPLNLALTILPAYCNHNNLTNQPTNSPTKHEVFSVSYPRAVPCSLHTH